MTFHLATHDNQPSSEDPRKTFQFTMKSYKQIRAITNIEQFLEVFTAGLSNMPDNNYLKI